jgi:hypothetical protein
VIMEIPRGIPFQELLDPCPEQVEIAEMNL